MLCSVAECENSVKAKNLCLKHYKRLRKHGSTDRPYKYTKIEQEICSVSDCDRKPKYNSGFCEKHHRRWIKYGVAEEEEWLKAKGSTGKRKYKYINGYVYLYLPEHPNANKSGVVAEHQIVMSNMLNRPLIKGENVHHKNGVRDDNRPENLELWVKTQPAGQRVEDLVGWAEEILKRYAPNKLVSENSIFWLTVGRGRLM